MSARPREFRPTPPRLRDRLTIAVFALLALGGIAGWIRERNAAPAAVALLMTAAGTWLYYRLRVFGSPRLNVDEKGLRYRCGKRDVSAAWTDVVRIEPEFYRDELRFIRRDGGSPIIVSIDMTTADGERFDMLIEEYWEPAGPRQRSRARPGRRA